MSALSTPHQTVRADGSATVRRRLSALSLIVCGIAVIAVFSIPHAERDSAPDFQSFVRAHGQLVALVGILSLVVVLSMVGGLVGLSAELARRHPALAVTGASIMVAGFVAYLVVVGTDSAMSAVALTAPEPVLAAALDGATNTALFNISFALFLIGHVVGPVVVCIAVWRSRFAPWPVALLLPVGAGIHLVADIIGSTGLDIAAFAVFGAGFIALGVYLTRTPVRA